ncbi:protein mono-ADP-ribosyltransferase PARP14 [Diretmus argenteus]
MSRQTIVLEGLPDDLDRVRAKLDLYFQNKRRSGGEILELQEDPTDKRRALLVYNDGAEMEKVCAKKVHDHGISVVGYNQTAVERNLDPRRFVLSGFDDDCICSFVSVYIGSCIHGAEHTWETLDDGDRIVVTFHQDIDANHFLKKCSTKTLQDKEIGAQRLELTDSVLVQGDLIQISEEVLSLYFSNRRSRGGDIKSLFWVSKNKSVVITFEECHVAHRVAEHKQSLAGKELIVQLFYSSLQKALTGQTSSQQNITTNIVIPVSADLLRFINLNEIHQHEFTSTLEKVNASVSVKMDAKPPQMELNMSIDKQSLGMLRHGHTWERNARREAQAQLARYRENNLSVEEEVWKGIESSCLELNTANACISFKISTSEIVVVGVEAEVKSLVEKVENLVEKASNDLQIKRDTVEKRIQLDSKEELDLIWHIVSDKLIDDVGPFKDDESFTICLKGLRNIVNAAEGIIKEAQDNVVSTKLELSLHLIKFLKSLDLKNLQSDHFAQNNIMAVLLPGEESFKILADKADIDKAEEKFNELIKDEVIELSREQVSVTRGEQWQQLLAALQGDLESSQNHQRISITLSGERIAVCGFSNVVADVLSKIRGYLENKKPVTVDVPLKSVQEVEFVESCMKLSEDPDLKVLGATAFPCKTPRSPCIKVTATSDKIKQATDAVTLCISTIITEKHMYSKAGEAKVLEKNQLILMAKAKLLGCDLQISQSAMINNQQYSYDIDGAVTLTLGQGFIAQHAADALICPLSSLAFDNPTAQQFLQFGGPQIKNVIDKCLKEKQSLMAGDVVLTNPGTLKSKTLIYAVIPVWGKGSPTLNTTYLETAVHQSLVRAANNQCASVVVGGVVVSLKKGDITMETVDIIVNSNNRNLDLNSGVSGAILKAAGKSVVDECKKHGTQKADGGVLTGGGRLNCKHIAQMIGPNSAADITAFMERVLQLCESKMAATVAIPTIGTGKGGIDPKSSVKAILKGIESHTAQTPSSSLQRIFIVAFEDRIFDSVKVIFNRKNSTQEDCIKILGVRIEVRKGNITNETVRGIVNSTSADINSKTGVSGAIFRAAGAAAEKECEKIRPLKGHEAAVTGGGALQCNYIIHMLGPHSAADASVRVSKVLQRCEENIITTVAFPAVGTGGGGLSGIASSGAILQGIKDHLSHCASTVLKLIFIVVDKDTILQEFLQGFSQWKTNDGMLDNKNDDDDDEDDSSDAEPTSSEEEEDSSSQTPTAIEALIHRVKVKVLCGDITKEKTDAIVSSTNTSLDLNSGVSGAILKAAGRTVVDECVALGTQPSDGVVITKPGNLPTKHIIHMVGQTTERDITSSMLKVLKMCEDHKIQSVSFPALGTGAGNLGALQVGNAMVTAIEDLLKTTNTPSLTTIHIVIFQSKMMKDFQEVLKKFKKVTPKPAATIKIYKPLQKTSSPTQSTSTTPAQQPPLCLASSCRAISFPTMEAEVFGCSAASLAQVKKLMDDMVSEECYSQDLTSRQLSLLQEPEKQAIVDLSQKNQVCILVSAQNRATVSGKRDDVLATVLHINDFLQKAKERESREGEERRLRETVRWEAGEGEAWGELDQSISLDLEQALHDKRQSLSYSHQGEMYTVDLRNFQQKDPKGTITRLKRTLRADSDTAVIQPPPSWTRMDNKDMDIVDLAPTSGEYKKVEADFIQTAKQPGAATHPTIKVVKIQRIQNKDQWQRYAVRKQALDKKYPTNKNEMNLYHGTTADICQKINTNGFNRSFCGRNATVYGDGTYFAKDSWYSCSNVYSNPDPNGLKYVYRAKVLVGKPCQGITGMKEPSPLNPSNPQAGLHDCGVDNPLQPSIFVVFCDAGAYPEYLISFKTS